MNNTLKIMLDMVLGDVVSNPNKVHTDIATKYINQSYFTVCASKRIEALIDKVTLTPIDGECVLPSDCVPDSIESIEDSDGQQYFRDESRGRGNQYYARNYYFDGIAPVLVTSDTASIDEGSTTLTTEESTFLTSHVGEYVAIGGSGTMYKITAFGTDMSVTISDPYRGDSETSMHIEVRPKPTYVIKFISDKMEALEPTTIYLTYQKLPLPLYNDYDPILVPGTGEDIRTMALQSMLRRLGKSREARMMADEVRIERALAAKDSSKKRYPFRATGFFRRPELVQEFGGLNVNG